MITIPAADLQLLGWRIQRCAGGLWLQLAGPEGAIYRTVPGKVERVDVVVTFPTSHGRPIRLARCTAPPLRPTRKLERRGRTGGAARQLSLLGASA